MEMSHLILIPAYNEENNIGLLLEKLTGLYRAENILVIDDGSCDGTPEIAEDAGVNLLINERNMGKGKTLMRGFKYAVDNSYETLITMDADLQHRPEEVPYFYDLYQKEEVDLIIGTRDYSGGQMPCLRFLVNKTTSIVTSLLSGVRIHDSQSGFRLISTDILEQINLRTKRFQMETEIIVKAARKNFSIAEIPVSTVYRKESRSHINPFVDTLRFVALAVRLMWR